MVVDRVKGILTLIALWLIILSISGCSAKTDLLDFVQSDSQIEVTEGTLERSGMSGAIDINICFPEIYHTDELVERKINEQIFEMITIDEIFAPTAERLEYSLAYKITCLNSEYISILFEGMSNIYARSYKLCQGQTYSLVTGEILSISDVVELQEFLDWIDVNENKVQIESELFSHRQEFRTHYIEEIKTKLSETPEQVEYFLYENGIKIIIYLEESRHTEYIILCFPMFEGECESSLLHTSDG
jgi:hypothetical protein